MNRNLILYGISAFALALIGFGVGAVVTNRPVPTLQDGSEIVASIDGKDFTAEELFESMKKASGASILINAIDEFIADKEVETNDNIVTLAKNQVAMYKSSITEQGGNWEDQIKEWGFEDENGLEEFFVKEEKKNTVVENYLKAELTDKQINDYYKNETFGEIVARHILISPDVEADASDEDKEAAEVKAKETANEVIEKLNNGEKWEDLVKEYSDDPGTKEDNGELSFFKKDVVAPFWEGALKLENGKYTETPVESEFGFHIIYKVEQKEKLALDEVVEDIKTTLITSELELENTFETVWIKIREKYNLELFDATINDLYKNVVSQF